MTYKDDLIKNIQSAFAKVKEVQFPEKPGPGQIEKIQDEIQAELAEGLATAIEGFMKSAQIKITGIQVEVEDINHNPIGRGSQKTDVTVGLTWPDPPGEGTGE